MRIGFFIFIILGPMLLSAQIKQKSNNGKVGNGGSYVAQGRQQLAKGDSMHAYLNFMRAKSMGYYKLDHFYDGGDEKEVVDDAVANCYDENRRIKESITQNQEFKKLNYRL